jgi:dTDP-4-amino-4,6-dideoxygalactose transaminase/glycosyltransferase involved in cell wall biosynthesis
VTAGPDRENAASRRTEPGRKGAAGGRLVVYAGGTLYDGVAGTDRQIADRLTGVADVLYVDPPQPVRRPARHRLRRVRPGLWRLTPVAPPGGYRPGLDRVTQAIARRAVRRAAVKIGAPIGAVIVAGSTDLLGAAAGARDVWYRTDDLVAGAELIRMSPARLAAAEKRMAARADAIAVVSPALADRVETLGRTATLLPNGCDVAAYDEVDEAPWPSDLPPQLAEQAVAGFIGHVNARIDLALLEAVADAGHPLVIVGPHVGDDDRFHLLASRPDVHWVGRKPYEELPSYLRVIDVGLTPYADTAFNRASFPLKTLEYLAAGRGAVATPLPATDWLDAGELIRTARTPEEFARATSEELARPRTPELRARRRAFAGCHDWDERITVLRDLLGLDAHTGPSTRAGAEARNAAGAEADAGAGVRDETGAEADAGAGVRDEAGTGGGAGVATEASTEARGGGWAMIPVMRPWLGAAEEEAVAEVIASGWVAQGPRVAAFERAFAESVGAEHGVAVTSCTTALHLALVLADIGPGDEVVVPSLSFIATANAVKYVGAEPVFADVDPLTANVTAKTVAAVAGPRTRAVIVVHQGGMPADVAEIAEAHPGLVVVEDAACAAGSVYRDRPVGAGASLAAWSFHPRKLLTTGEGGMITLTDGELAARARRLREHGMSVSAADRHASGTTAAEQYLEVGFNYRMTDLQAAVGLVQLGRLAEMIERRRLLAARYHRLLTDVPGLRMVTDPPYGRTNYQSFWMEISQDFPVNRDELLAILAQGGVSARRGIMAAHLEPPYGAVPRPDLPVTERLTGNTLILPLFHTMTEAEQDRVAEVVRTAGGR